jgi:hypothetical protein
MLKETLTAGIAAFLLAASPAGGAAINFDSFPGMNFLGGVVPAASQLSNQLHSATGAVFSSEGGADYVAVANLEIGSPSAHAPSPPNGIGAVTAANQLFYGIPIVVTFFDPTDVTRPAVTDFVSVRADLRGIPGSVRLVAYGVDGSQIGSDTQPDSLGPLLSVSTPGIHSVTFFSDSGTVAFDDLTFNPVAAVPDGVIPEPGTLALMLGGGLALVCLRGRFAA